MKNIGEATHFSPLYKSVHEFYCSVSDLLLCNVCESINRVQPIVGDIIYELEEDNNLINNITWRKTNEEPGRH